MTVVDVARASRVWDASHHRAAVRYAWGAHLTTRDWDEDDVPITPLIDAMLVGGTPLRDEASMRGCAQIDQLVAEGYVTGAVAARGRDLITFLFKPNTVDAAISPDGDGLSFYWAAQEMSLTIIVYRDEYWWSVRNIAGDTYSAMGVDLPLINLMHSINLFSKEVERRNPDWRSLIR